MDYANDSAARGGGGLFRRRRTVEGLTAFLVVLAALPAGLALNLAMYFTGRFEPEHADRAGFTVTLTAAALGTVLGWHARQRIQRHDGALYGMTSSTLAMLGGLCILAACGVVTLKTILRTQ